MDNNTSENTTKEKLAQRLSWQSYVIIGSIALGLASLTLLIPSDWAASTICMGIATSCFSSVLIFAILKIFMSDSNDILLDKIKNVTLNMLDVNNANRKSNEILTETLETFIKNASPKHTTVEKDALSEFFQKLKFEKCDQLIMCGYSMAHVFASDSSTFIELLKKNVRIKVLLVDPESSSGQLMRDKLHREGLSKLHEVGEPHKRTLRYINAINNQAYTPDSPNQITVSKVSWIPSATIILASNKAENYYVLLEGINGFILSNKVSRRLYSVYASTEKDKKISFYTTHFEMLWAENEANIYHNLEEFIETHSN